MYRRKETPMLQVKVGVFLLVELLLVVFVPQPLDDWPCKVSEEEPC